MANFLTFANADNVYWTEFWVGENTVGTISGVDILKDNFFLFLRFNVINVLFIFPWHLGLLCWDGNLGVEKVKRNAFKSVLSPNTFYVPCSDYYKYIYITPLS